MKFYNTPKLKLFIFLLFLVIVHNIYYYQTNLLKAKANPHTQNLEQSKVSTLIGPLPIPDKELNIKLPILMFHHIGTAPDNANSTREDMTQSPEDFELEIKWLSEQGFNSVRLEDIYLYSLGKKSLPAKPIVFTFDDGYEDAFINAVPILKKYNFIGSFAIITGWQGETFGDNTYATWSQIAQVKNEGMEIISHTQNHFDGSNAKFNSDYIYQNLTGSIVDIANHLDFTSNILIYPYGHYTSDYINQAKKAGFVMGLTVHEGSYINLNNLMEIPRVRVHGKQNFEIFKKIIQE